jgi:hypothetical protein
VLIVVISGPSENRQCFWEEKRTHIAESCQDKLSAHASNVGGTHVGAIHQTHAVHGANREDKASVNAVNDSTLLGRRKAMANVFLVLDLAGRLVMFVVGLLLQLQAVISAIHGEEVHLGLYRADFGVKGREEWEPVKEK